LNQKPTDPGIPNRFDTRESDSGLIDEFSITLAPVLFGTGIRLFDRVDPDRLALDQARTHASSRVTHLTYTAVKR
jgi:dihydrofolate reductase